MVIFSSNFLVLFARKIKFKSEKNKRFSANDRRCRCHRFSSWSQWQLQNSHLMTNWEKLKLDFTDNNYEKLRLVWLLNRLREFKQFTYFAEHLTYCDPWLFLDIDISGSCAWNTLLVTYFISLVHGGKFSCLTAQVILGPICAQTG